MENFLNTSTLLTSAGFSLNTDILETNLINIAILIVVLVQFLGRSLTTALTERKQKIIDSVTDAEKSYEIAKSRLDEANNQLAQTKIAIDKIVQELRSTKTKIIKTGAERICQEMLSQIQTSELTIALQEQKLITRSNTKLLIFD
jgi:F-type H+-transporting ATPase subunit b